jgi:hypothetical protein
MILFKKKLDINLGGLGWVMVFNATFNNISVILWCSLLLVEETGGPGETNDLMQVTDKLST